MKYLLTLAALAGLSLSALLATSIPARSQTVVLCYDSGRALIQRVADYDCKHQIISKQEADAIRARRAAYVRQAIENDEQPTSFGTGSGFFVSRYGEVITNRHVVAKCGGITVLTAGGQTHEARIVSMSSKYDLALLRTDSIQSSVATITSVVPHVGSSIDVVGFPSSLRPRRVSVRTNGRYRGARAGGSGVKIMSVGVRVSGGSSGSPVLDDKGRVIGVVFAKMDTRQPPTRNGIVPSRRSEDIALATSARNLTTFLRGNGVKVSANTTAQNRAEDYAVRVNCLE